MNKEYAQFIKELKGKIVSSRYIAARLANKEQLMLYYQTGKGLSERIATNRWGTKVIDQISEDLQRELPGLRGFSPRNLRNMREFYEAYQEFEFLQSSTAKIQALPENRLLTDIGVFFSLSFTHHMVLIAKCKDLQERFFYMQAAAAEFWSVAVLQHHIEAGLFQHQGRLPNNFQETIPENVNASALNMFQDEYLLDYIQANEGDTEKEVENKVVRSIRDFILRAGKGFCFIGNQYRLEVEGDEFFVDLLFFNRILHCMVAFELKNDKFRPEHAGQLNFYLNVLNDQEKLPDENPAIGIVLCKDKNNAVVEFSIKNIDGVMGVATYKTTRRLPEKYKGILPDPSDLRDLL